METEDGSLQKTVTRNKTFCMREERGQKLSMPYKSY